MPEFSIVVATRNRPQQLSRLLAAVAKLDFPPSDFELIVVDDESDEPLDTVVRAYQHQLQLRLVRQKQGGPAKGRNTGVRAAAGRNIAFTDDDCAPDPDWLTVLASTMRQHPGAMVGGIVVNALSGNVFSAASQFIMDLVYAHYNRDRLRARFLATNNMAFPREPFEALGGFDESFPFASEDRDLCDRWRHAGHPSVYQPAAVVNHFHALTLRKFWRQHFSYGRGAALFHRAAELRGSGKLSDHFSFHAGWPGWFRNAWRHTAPPRPAAMSALLVVWQAANAAGYFYERLRR